MYPKDTKYFCTFDTFSFSPITNVVMYARYKHITPCIIVIMDNNLKNFGFLLEYNTIIFMNLLF
jgi:hypothetical protein